MLLQYLPTLNEAGCISKYLRYQTTCEIKFEHITMKKKHAVTQLGLLGNSISGYKKGCLHKGSV